MQYSNIYFTNNIIFIIQGRMKTIILVKVQITVKEAGQVIQFFT